MTSEELSASPNDQIAPLWKVVCLAVFLTGCVLRYEFICITNRPIDPANIIGDAGWYINEAVHFFDKDYVVSLYNTLFPPGAPFYYAVLRTIDPSMDLLILTQWLLSCLLPPLLALTAFKLFGRENAVYVLLFSSLYFPLWEFFGYFISEGPFIFALYSAFLLLILSLQAKTAKTSIIAGLAGGVMLGGAAACKSVALLTAGLVFTALLALTKGRKHRTASAFFSALVGVALVIAPVSIRATRLNEGRFLLIANDAPRTFLLGHQGRVGLTWWIDKQRNFQINFINPSTSQHNYIEQRTYNFGPYDGSRNYAAGLDWIRNNPLEALLLSIEHVFDMFAIALPWPGYFRDYAEWTIFFNEIFIALILFPALLHLAKISRSILRRDTRYLYDLLTAAAAFSIYLIAFLFLGEGRYRICYDGFMILLASRAFFSPKSKSAAAAGQST